MVKLINACRTKLNESTPGLPDLSGAVMRYLRRMVFEKMQRSMVEGRMQAVPFKIESMAALQPFQPQQIKELPTGYRAWSWYLLHTLTDLELAVNDRFVVGGKKFKNMAKANWSSFGYYEYRIISDTEETE
jgi:hypothetical protein